MPRGRRTAGAGQAPDQEHGGMSHQLLMILTENPPHSLGGREWLQQSVASSR